MATISLEKRLSAVEAELADIKRRLNGNGVHAPTALPDKNVNGAAPVRQQTIGEKFAAIRAQNPEAWNDSPSDKTAGALDAALATLWRDTPDEAWDKLPADFGDNLDHYLYGTPKR